MRQRGRKSAASLAIARITPRAERRPPPLPELTADQSTVWTSLVARMPSGWFEEEHFATLAAYCRHVCRSRFVSAVLDAFKPEELTDADGLNRYRKLAAEAERETRAILACARTLRITHQSQVDPVTAGRRVGSLGTTGRKPWNFTADDVR